jgi:hypothetical protein
MAAIVVGLAVMVGAGLMAAPYSSGLDPDATCRVHERCDPVANADAVRRLWWWCIGGFVVVTAGLAWLGWTRRAGGSAGRTPPSRAVRWPAVLQGGASGGVAGALFLVASYGLILSIIVSSIMFTAALTTTWLTQAWALDRVHRAAVPDATATSRFAVSVCASAAGLSLTTLTVWLGRLSDVTSVQLWAALLNGFIVAALVLADRLLAMLPIPGRTGGFGRGGSGRVGAAAGLLGLVTAIVGALTAATVGVGVLPDRQDRGGEAVGPAPVPSDTSPAPMPEATVIPAPSTTPGTRPTAPSVSADVACGADDLSLTTTGWDAAMGLTAVTVVATNTGGSACYVEGFADITLSQGSDEVRLAVGRSAPLPDGATDPGGRVGIAPGGQARFHVTWDGYRQQADRETPQDLVVKVAESDVPVELTDGPAPFDVVDGAEVDVGPWLAGGVA